MKALIIEDEKMAQMQLRRLLSAGFPDIEVVDCLESVSQTVDYLAVHPPMDMIFMDVELSDGDCFEIFRQVDVKVPVIMTTAYDSYAIKAFEAGSIDYLLKPIDPSALSRAVARVRERGELQDKAAMLSAAGIPPASRYKDHITIKVGDRFFPVEASQIACFTSEDKYNYLTLLTGEKYLTDLTLEAVEAAFDPQIFFRISRGAIVSRSSILEVVRHPGGRLRLICQPASSELVVARARVRSFLGWLG